MSARQQPTQYPSPQSDRGPHHARSLRTNPQTTVRQPDLGSPPQVVSLTNLGGAGAGAYVINNGSDADKTQGCVLLNVGPGQSGNPVLTLKFPAGIAGGQYVFFAEWCSISAGAPAGGNIALTCTPNRTLVGGERLLLAYQLAVST